MKTQEPTPHSGAAVRKGYKVVAKYSLDTGNRLEEIGPEAVTHIVAFWNYLSPLFMQVHMEATEKELRNNQAFVNMTSEEQRIVLVNKWNEYVQKHHILESPHAWVLDQTKYKPSKLG